MSTTSRTLGLATVFAMLAAPALADERADDGVHIGSDHNQINGVRFDVHADIGNYGAFGAGFRADIPIVANGLINGVNDELAISPGVELFFLDVYPHSYSGGPYVMPVAMLQWNFYLGERWSVFPEVGLALYVGDADHMPSGRAVHAGIGTAIGARYHFSTRNALLLRAGWPAGLQAGLTF